MMRMIFNGKPTKVVSSSFLGTSMIARIGKPTTCGSCPGAK